MEDEEEGVIPPTPVPKEWDSLGSDLEIKEGFMEPGRPLVSGVDDVGYGCVGFHINGSCNDIMVPLCFQNGQTHSKNFDQTSSNHEICDIIVIIVVTLQIATIPRPQEPQASHLVS